MTALSTIAESLHLFGKSINRQSITKVTFEFVHSPTDLPEVDDGVWTVLIKLVGTTDIEEKDATINFTQEFFGKGASEGAALDEALAIIKDRITSFAQSRREETLFAIEAVNTVSTDAQLELSSLWPSTETPVTSETSS